jgi:hypothetical protein
MKIELLYTPYCPGYAAARQFLFQVLAEENVPAEVEEIPVETQADAQRLEFLGTPSIRVEGMDVEGWLPQSHEYSLRCRVYRENGKSNDHPSKELIRAAIRAARDVKEFSAAGCC